MSQNHDRHFPPLAPGPRTPIIGESATVPRLKKNSTACQPCKQAKRKCSGPPSPCRACDGSDSECIFDESLDLRRKVAIRRTIAELEDSRDYYRNLVHSLLTTLRSPNQNRVDSLLNLVRSNASLLEIATVAADPSVNLNDSSLGDLTNLEGSRDNDLQLPCSSFTDSHTQVTLEMLCDTPLFQVPAKPWTAITDDNHLVSHLVSLHFTWDNPFSQLIDQKTFLEEMAKGDLDSDFCTPFLVNSLLAMASAYSDFPKVLAAPGDMNSRGQHFYQEAERLWKAEEGRVTLPNIQGMIFMCYVLRYQGKDRSSWLMLKQAVQLAQDMGMFQPRRTLHPNEEEKFSGMQRIFAITALGVFVLNAQMSLEMGKTVDLTLPGPRPYTIDDLDDDVMWTPYPHTNQNSYVEKPSLLRFVTVELAYLAEILADISSLLFDKAFDMGVDDLWLAAERLYSRLRIRLDRLPDALEIDDLEVPQALFVRIKYHQAVISLFNSLLDHFGHASPSWFDQARRTRLESAKEIAKYLHIQRQSYGLKQVPCQMIEAVHRALITTLAELDDVESKLAFVELCRFAMAFRQRLQSADKIIQTIERTVNGSGIKLPSEAVTILDVRL